MIAKKIKRLFGIHTASEKDESGLPPQAPKAPQVFRGRENIATPALFKDTPPAELPKVCKENLVCEFICRITRHRIYGEGNGDISATSATFEGITANCDAIKRFGKEIAQEDGYSGTYRYADLNHIYECCCGDPGNCRFYNRALTEQTTLAQSR